MIWPDFICVNLLLLGPHRFRSILFISGLLALICLQLNNISKRLHYFCGCFFFLRSWTFAVENGFAFAKTKEDRKTTASAKTANIFSFDFCFSVVVVVVVRLAAECFENING